VNPHSETERLMHQNEIIQIIPRVKLIIGNKSLLLSLHEAVIRAYSHAALQMSVNLTSTRLGHGVPDHLRIDRCRVYFVHFVEPNHRNIEQVDKLIERKLQCVVIAADDKRVPFVVFESIGCRVRVFRFDAAESLRGRVTKKSRL
jgi:hypothetical protein